MPGAVIRRPRAREGHRVIDLGCMSIDRHDVMRERADAEHLPALAVLRHVPKVDAGRFQRVVVLHPEVSRPSDAVGLEVEGALVAMRMAGHREAALDPQIIVLLGGPAASVYEDGRGAPALEVVVVGHARGRVRPAVEKRNQIHREQPFFAKAFVSGHFHDPHLGIHEGAVADVIDHPSLHVLPRGFPVSVRETVTVPRRGGGEADECGGSVKVMGDSGRER